MFKKRKGDTRQMAAYSHLHPFLAHPVLLAIGNHKKRDGCHDQNNFTGVKLMAIPVIRAVRSPILYYLAGRVVSKILIRTGGLQTRPLHYINFTP